MAVAALDTRITPAQAFMEMRAQIGVDGQQETEAPRVAEANILNVSDAGRLSAYDMLFNTENHEISDNRMFGSRHHDENNENSEQGKERKADSIRRMGDALGGGSGSWGSGWESFKETNDVTRTAGQAVENVWAFATNPIGTLRDGAAAVEKAGEEFKDDPLGTTGNVLSSTAHLLTGGIAGYFGVKSREEIAEELEAERAAEAQNVRVPAQSREERIASATQTDVSARPQSQFDLTNLFANAGRALGITPAPEQEQALTARVVTPAVSTHGLG